MIRQTLNSRPGLDFPVTKSHAFGRSMTAAHYKLDNLTAIIDNNGLQIDGFVAEGMNIEPIAAKWLAFGWHAMEIDGHDMGAILQALDEAEQLKGRPSVIVDRTIKGARSPFGTFRTDAPGYH